MKKFAKALAVVVCVAAATGAMAQEKKTSIWAQGNYMKSDNTDATGTILVGAGYLLSPKIEVGGQVMTILGTTSTTYLQVEGQYYLNPVGKANQVIPYAKAAFGTSTGGTYNTTNYGGFVGVSYALTESAEAFVEGGIQSLKSSYSTVNQTDINFGLKFRF